jgi:hypothetical protein
MVMVITFLTVTNIALGYGLALYVHKHFGTLTYQRKPKAIAAATSQPSAPAAVVAAVPVAAVPVAAVSVAENAPAAPPTPAPVVAETPAPPAPSEITAEAESIVTEIPGESAPVDEENVLAGIEEFRSQLAKMSGTTEQFADESQEELLGAAN